MAAAQTVEQKRQEVRDALSLFGLQENRISLFKDNDLDRLSQERYIHAETFVDATRDGLATCLPQSLVDVILTAKAPPPPQANNAMTIVDYGIQDAARMLRELFWGSKSNQKAVEPAEACAGLVSPNPHQPHMIVHSGVRKRTAYSRD